MTEPVGKRTFAPPSVEDAPALSGPAACPPKPEASSATADAQSAATRLLVERCGSAKPNVGTQPAARPASWWVEKGASEAACHTLPPKLALRTAEMGLMPAGGLARKMMDHFLSGSSAPVHVDLNAELARNPQLSEYVASRIESELSARLLDGETLLGAYGAIWVPQSAYGSTTAGRDQQLALGGTYFEYEVVGSAPNGDLEVKLNVADHYFWTPSDAARPTHCLHQGASRLVAAGSATEFYQMGEGRIFVVDPSRDQPMEPLLVETDGAR
jgi:hypothetical protein